MNSQKSGTSTSSVGTLWTVTAAHLRPELTSRFPVAGRSASEAHLMELPADGLAAHWGPGDLLKLGGESFDGRQTTFLRYFLQHLAVPLFELVRTAAPGQSRRYTSTFPVQNNCAHGGLRQVQQGRNLPDWLLTLITSHDSAPLEVTELLASAPHPKSDVLTFDCTDFRLCVFFFYGFVPLKPPQGVIPPSAAWKQTLHLPGTPTLSWGWRTRVMWQVSVKKVKQTNKLDIFALYM